MSIKIECDVCGDQQDSAQNTMVPINLPELPYRNTLKGEVKACSIDACDNCARRIHHAAKRVPQESDEVASGRPAR